MMTWTSSLRPSSAQLVTYTKSMGAKMQEARSGAVLHLNLWGQMPLSI